MHMYPPPHNVQGEMKGGAKSELWQQRRFKKVSLLPLRERREAAVLCGQECGRRSLGLGGP